MVSSWTEQDLAEAYKTACINGDFGSGGDLYAGGIEFDPVDMDNDGEDIEQDPVKPDSDNPCFDFLQQVRKETAGLAPEQEDAVQEEVEPEEALLEKDLKGLPESERKMVRSILSGTNPSEPFQVDGPGTSDQVHQRDHPEYLPWTLLDALLIPGENIMNKLWRFLVRLRASKGGCDRGFLKNPLSARRASKGLNWYQQLGLCMLMYAYV